MSIKITTDVHCDHCPNWLHGMTSFAYTRGMATSARQLAHGADWVTRRSGGGEPLLDICPECQEREQEKKNETHSRTSA